jgi:hypothetical protein
MLTDRYDREIIINEYAEFEHHLCKIISITDKHVVVCSNGEEIDKIAIADIPNKLIVLPSTK